MKHTFLCILVLSVTLLSCGDSLLPRGYQAITVCSESLPGRVFDDCLDPQWQNLSAWQLMPGNEAVLSYTRFDDDKLVKWDYVEEPGHGKVLEIIYNDFYANGAFVMNSADNGARSDMTAYAQGALEFDVRLLEAIAPYPHLVVKIDCGYPCQSEEILVDKLPFGEWQSVSVPIAPLIRAGLDITQVSSAAVVVPPWSQMRGYRYQLDNIRWVAP